MVYPQKIQQVVNSLVDKLQTNYSPQKIILFGSYASGNQGPDSDLDLLIIKETSERFIDRWVSVRRILSDPTRKIPLETIVLTPQEIEKRLAIGDQFLMDILRKGVILYEA